MTLRSRLAALAWLGAAALPPGCASLHAHTPATTLPSASAMVSSATLPAGNAAQEKAIGEMAEAALAFWNALPPDLQSKCKFPFDDDERFNWHFVPRARKGVTWNDMSPAQQAHARAFLASGLSARGFQQAQDIQALDEILKVLEAGRGPLRDPGNYAFSVFGTPGAQTTWGWRFEGHHLALNITVVNGRAVAGPVFFGTNPAEVLQGPKKGLRILAVEEDLGRELVKSLTEDQKKIAVYTTRAPSDIITGNMRKADAGLPVGLLASEMTASQQKLLMTLVENYAYRLRPEIADEDLKKIAAAGFGKIRFGWAGGLEPGQGHYYRIQGPTFLVEFDNTQNRANHIHTVWRDAVDDFGEDLLKRHYEQAKNAGTHPHPH